MSDKPKDDEVKDGASMGDRPDKPELDPPEDEPGRRTHDHAERLTTTGLTRTVSTSWTWPTDTWMQVWS